MPVDQFSAMTATVIGHKPIVDSAVPASGKQAG